VSARALAVLDRFPLHMAATDPEKRFGLVVGALTDALEVLTRQVGDVRRAHRLAEAPTTADLLALAALHGFTESSFAPLSVRLAGLAARHLPSLDLRRTLVTDAIAAHIVGNGTPAALLTAAAAYLGLEVEQVTHTEDRWWHLARCRDRVRLEPDPGAPPTPAPDLVALEENPFRNADLDPAPKRHGELFRVLRGGLDDVDVTVRVRGVGTRTVRPLVVQVYAGRGLGFEGDVPDGAELRFETSGRATLDGTDVTGSAWSFSGAVFASGAATLPGRDFVFAGEGISGDRVARFVQTAPLPAALDPAAGFPHGAAAVGPLRLPLGESRWAGFVRVAHAGSPVSASPPPRTKRARFDAAVFAERASIHGVSAGAPSMGVGFAWEEREPFAVRVLLPRRLRAIDDETGTQLRQPLRLLLDRHRAAGVDVRVEYADPRWTLGAGVVRDTEDEALGTVLAGTELWPDGTPQPNPS